MNKTVKSARYTIGVLPGILLIIVLTAPAFPLFPASGHVYSQEKIASGTSHADDDVQTDPVIQRSKKLQENLQLTDQQAAEVQKIFRNSRIKTDENRKRFKANAPALVKAARDLRRDTHSSIRKLLDESQIETFEDMTKMTRFDRELFELTEGLMLDEDQSFTVEGILIEHENRLKEMIPPELLEMAENDDAPGKSDRIHFGRGGNRDNRGMMPGGGRIRKALKSLQKKKYKAIKKILDKEQKLLLKQLREDRKNKMEAPFKK
jgi:hypothetical protein